MKKHFLLILAFLLPAVFYAMGSFMALSFDPRMWSEGGRSVYAIYSFIAFAGCSVGWWLTQD